jgi:outer membrane immunogenic protein
VAAGYAWGHSDVGDVTGYNGAPPTGNFSYDPNGWVGNVYFGYNWQFNTIVVGLEGEVGYLGVDGSQQYPPYVGVRGSDDSVASTNAGWYGAITGRIGIAFQNFLVFAKGGYALTGITNSFIDSNAVGLTLVSGTETDTRNGWTIGGGVEAMFARNWIARAEFDYYDFGTVNHTALASNGVSYTFSHSLTVSVVKGGLAYKF